MRRPTRTVLALAFALCGPTLTTTTAAQAQEPATLPITWNFDDGLQGWTVEELPLTTEADSFSEGRGRHDTTWQLVPEEAGGQLVALTALGGEVEKYGDDAHVALVSPVLDGDGTQLEVESVIGHHLEGGAWDHVHLEWAPVGGAWTLIESFGDGGLLPFAGLNPVVSTVPTFSPDGYFQIRFRLVSDILGSGVTPNPFTYDTFRLAEVRVTPDAADRPWVVDALPGRGSPGGPTAVLAFTSAMPINPYHHEFRDRSPRARRHPSTYVDGYPADATALVLSLDAPSLADAVFADQDVLTRIEPDKLYWIPGTKLVGILGASLIEGGAVQVCGAPADEPATCDLRPINQYLARTTWAASQAVGTTIGACPDCRLAVFAGKGPNSVEATLANADWIDAAAVVLTTEDAGAARAYGDFVTPVARLAERMVVTTHSRYADLDRGLDQVPFPTALHVPGRAPGVVMVGGHDDAHVYAGNDVPTHLVADVCRIAVAAHDSMTTTSNTGHFAQAGQGQVLGRAGQLLVEARRVMHNPRRHGDRIGPLLEDGELDAVELRRLLLTTATARPSDPGTGETRCALEQAPDPTSPEGRFGSLPIAWSDVPSEAPGYVNLGYGATDDAALSLALDVLHGDAPMPDRAHEDAWFTLDDAARDAIQVAWESALGSLLGT